tara:strand:+ start:7076 stop:7525 length:450 start_codon:yes stop_codon:yes gene_type:complete
MNDNEKSNLKLVGKNQEDLKIISAYLQDSIVSVKDMVFLKKNRSFVMIVNRFMWEDIEKGVFRQSKRIRCAVKFEDVVKVKSKNINQNNKNKPLECLTIKSNFFDDESYKIDIFFSGDSIITIISEAIEVVIKDLGKSWNTKYVPDHKI